MKKILFVLLPLLLLSGCNREPVYRGLNFEVFNYTPLFVDTVRVRGQDGKGGGSGSVAPGGGEGSISCCGSLRGTDFDVYWTAVDDDEVASHMYDGRFDEFVRKKTTKVHFPPTRTPPGDGPLYFEIHIYPDEHIEFVLTRELIHRTRIPIVAVGDWMMKNYGTKLNPDDDPYAKYDVNRKVARIIADAWKKYRIEDEQDLRQYVYLAMLVNPKFDDFPQFRDLLRRASLRPGDLSLYVQKLSANTITTLKQKFTGTGAVHD